MNTQTYDLEERLLEYSVRIIKNEIFEETEKQVSAYGASPRLECWNHGILEKWVLDSYQFSKYSIFNIQYSIPVYPGWDDGIEIPRR
jgi:hypothetical protein